jgi:hypothetical protein
MSVAMTRRDSNASKKTLRLDRAPLFLNFGFFEPKKLANLDNARPPNMTKPLIHCETIQAMMPYPVRKDSRFESNRP